MRNLVILGSTGSIGTQALSVVNDHLGVFCVKALAAGGSNISLLAAQVVVHEVDTVAITQGRVDELETAILETEKQYKVVSRPREILWGPEAASELAGRWPDATVLNGITGGVGLGPTLAALQAGATLALANKESLIVGGSLVREACVRPGQVVPVDSEHSALAQALQAGVHECGLTAAVVSGRSEVSNLVLTASGGPFRGRKRAELGDVTPKQALNHPTWRMGPVVTINSSTLVNKGLELIEANRLFDIAAKDIITVAHPQSVIHSMVTWCDGSTIAQASPPDMRIPIALGLSWPERMEAVAPECTWDAPLSWQFEPIDDEVFPAIALARTAIDASETHPAVYNAANEVLVEEFLRGRLPYLGIVDTLEDVLSEHEGINNPSLEEVLHVQKWAANQARTIAERM